MATTRRDRRTKIQWQAVIDEQASSGMGIPEYCDIHDIPVASFRRWQRNLDQDKSTLPSRFIELPNTEDPEVMPSPGQRIELDLGNGMTLRVYS